MKKIIKVALLSVLGLVVVFGVLMWLEFGSLVKGALSAEKLDDGLYYIEYRGYDGFDGLMDQGGFESADQMNFCRKVITSLKCRLRRPVLDVRPLQ